MIAKCKDCNFFKRFSPKDENDRMGECQVVKYQTAPFNKKIVFTHYFCQAFSPKEENK